MPGADERSRTPSRTLRRGVGERRAPEETVRGSRSNCGRCPNRSSPGSCTESVWTWLGILTALALSGALVPTATASPGTRADRHVLLLSVDGLHASDLAMWINDRPGSNLADLANRGTTYANAFSSQPSDSFPGLLAMVTGGTPRSTGVYYDDGPHDPDRPDAPGLPGPEPQPAPGRAPGTHPGAAPDVGRAALQITPPPVSPPGTSQASGVRPLRIGLPQPALPALHHAQGTRDANVIVQLDVAHRRAIPEARPRNAR